jgi:two-component system sensor histidine kinase CpxA
VDVARDRAVGGEGLGLAIAARAIALHKGVIEARNLASGGLAVSVTLPALPAGTITQVPQTAEAPEAPAPA